MTLNRNYWNPPNINKDSDPETLYTIRPNAALT